MAETLTLEVITPERAVLDKVEVKALIVPALDGLLGVLPGHAPLVAGLGIGVVKYKEDGADRYTKMAITGGFLEVSDNHAVLVADAAEKADSIDLLRARQARDRAQARLRDRSALIDYARAELALQRALNRLQVAGDAEESARN